ncbi:hypothetical protein QTP81_03365 [Alteromonas sp. ASW11-36]|uniref:Phenylacetate--CoA ligase family protein n=1 Tax=Alteromonas arenosi TaxID=3055817 RepID=A0ABT7STX4_9ALTE|nr:hypothetical protein [Alteromonas sp. ASW11-36]MDM7859646.1 hypothetical protein [Alteromonas sp. ASW11-36]
MISPFAKLVFWAGARLRNPSLKSIYRELKQQESFTRAELEALQLEKLQKLLNLAYEHSAYYRQVFDDLNLHPDDIQSIADLQQLPTMSKQTLIAENSRIHTSFPFAKRMLAETSGTSGEALEFYRNEEWDSQNRANVMRNYDWYGVNVWDKNGYFWGYNLDQKRSWKIRLLDWLQNRSRIFRYDDASIANFAKNLSGAKYLSGYSSMIYQIAKKVNQLGIKLDDIKMVKGTSEMILDAYQPEVKQAFGRKMISEYGAAESGLIAFECPQGNMHINMESVIVETDENNEVIITNLASLSFPIIRYRLGDCVTLSEQQCACGRAHPIIADIMGRKGASIKGNEQQYPALTFYYVFKNIAMEHGVLINYKARQETLGHVDITLEGKPNEQWQTLIAAEMDKYFGQDLAYKLTYTERFEEQVKKQQYFESTLGD